MRPLLPFITALLFIQSLTWASETNVSTKVESVTLYHSGALVSRTSSQSIKPGVNELVFENLSSKMVLNSLKFQNKQITILNKNIIRKLSSEEFNQLLDKKEALNKQMSLIEAKYAEEGFVGDVEALEKMTAFYSSKTLSIKQELRANQALIDEAKKLENIDLKNEAAAILKVIVSIDGRLLGPLKMQYVCGGIGWSPSYDINVHGSGDKTIEVKYLARAMSQTGEDWDNVSISLSSSFPLEAPASLPKPESPWVLKGGRSTYNQQLVSQYSSSQTAQLQDIDRLEGVDYDEISIPSFLKLRTLEAKYSIKSNSTVFTFPIQTVQLPTSFNYYGFPSLEPAAYLIAQVTDWDTLGFVDGIANITFAGNDIGKSIIKFSEAKDTLVLPIGKDNSVYMKRTEITDQKYFKVTTIGKKRKTTLAYQYELKNNNSFPVKFELLDQIPITQTKSAEVEMEKVSGARLNNEEGTATWLIDLKPAQRATKQLIFTIEMDHNYKYRTPPLKTPRYKKMYSPKF